MPAVTVTEDKHQHPHKQEQHEKSHCANYQQILPAQFCRRFCFASHGIAGIIRAFSIHFLTF
jgi:hypothetical protein